MKAGVKNKYVLTTTERIKSEVEPYPHPGRHRNEKSLIQAIGPISTALPRLRQNMDANAHEYNRCRGVNAKLDFRQKNRARLQLLLPAFSRDAKAQNS